MTDTEKDDAVEPEAPVDPDAVQITINGRAVAARKGEYVIAAAERAGEYIPRFCYHNRMSSVGMCRMCLVEIDTGRGPQIQPSCMVTVAPDMAVDTESYTTKRAQEGVLELLLINHPLDCPVCDKGGECPLQDQTFSHGPGESRFLEEKRHFEKPIPINDLVLLDRERCILCDRCTRFADEVAGDALIHFTQRGNQTQVMTFPDEPFSSYFSGNTVQICPVGALTATPYRFKARPWDLAENESTCMGCSMGCRITVQSSRDQLVRYLGVDSDAVNWGWLCDKGRFGFEATNSPNRVTTPLVRGDDGLAETSWNAAMRQVADALGDTPAERIALLGGSRGTNEDAYAWAQLADAIGIGRRDAQLGDDLPPEVLKLPRATINETTAAPTIILLGPDPKESLGVLYLRLRHVAEHRTSKLIELSPTTSGLTRNAWRSVRVAPGASDDAIAALKSDEIAAQLAAGPVVIVAGRSNLAESAASAAGTLRAVFEHVAAVQTDVKVLPVLRRGNVAGALRVGLRPQGGENAEAILRDASYGQIDVLVLLGADPVSDFPDAVLARAALDKVDTIVAVDTFLTDSSSLADVVLPAAAFGEKSGTTTNVEGRVSAVRARVTSAGSTRPDWMIAAELADRLGHDDLAVALHSEAALTDQIARSIAGFGAATAAAVDAAPDGVLIDDKPVGIDAISEFSVSTVSGYDYRLVVARKMYDQATMTANAESLAPLAGDGEVHLHPADYDKLGVTGTGSVRLTGSRGELVAHAVADDAVARGTVYVPFNRGTAITTLIDATAAVTDLRIEAVTG